MALNKVMLIGNVGNDPEIRYLDSNPQSPQGNAKVASFRLATTERYRDRNGETRENTEWHNIVAWRSNADLVEKFVHKGSQIFIEGKLRTRQWTDQTGNKRFTTEVIFIEGKLRTRQWTDQTGNKRFTTEVQADNIQLLGKRPDAPQGGQGGYQGGYSGQGFQGQGTQGGYAPAAPAGPAPMGPSQPAAPAYAPQPAQPATAPVYPAPGAAPAPSDAPDDDLPF